MLCEICGKNEATIHIEEITDGKSKTLHLCGECMAKNSRRLPDNAKRRIPPVFHGQNTPSF